MVIQPEMALILEPKEESALEAFRRQIVGLTLSEHQNRDIFLIRWLRARSFNITKAEEMLRKYLQWRVDNQIDRILSWEPHAIFRSDLPITISGFDHEGCPVIISAVGKWDLPKLVQMKLKGEYQRYIEQIMETAQALCAYQSRKTGKNIAQIIGIADLDGLTYSRFCSKDVVDMSLEGVKTVEAMYPEVLKAGIGVNAPKVFTLVYAVLKPFFSEYTQSKISLHGFNTEQWRNFLRERIPADQLPSQYGGSNTTSGHYDQRISFDEIGKPFAPMPCQAMTEVMVQAGQTYEVHIDPLRMNSTLMWAFKSLDYDIGFALVRRQGKKSEELVQVEKADSHLNVQRGLWEINEQGQYFLQFDNSYSKYRAKTVSYLYWMAEE